MSITSVNPSATKLNFKNLLGENNIFFYLGQLKTASGIKIK